MIQYSDSLYPQSYTQKKNSSGAKSMIDTMCLYSLVGFVAGLVILLLGNLHLFS